jgi:hypothetical protein
LTIRQESEQFALNCLIHGESHTALAETTTFFLSLQQQDDADRVLQVKQCIDEDEESCSFDFASLTPEQ